MDMPSDPSARFNDPAAPANWRAMFGWRRLRTVAILCTLIILLFSFGWKADFSVLVTRIFCGRPVISGGRITPRRTSSACSSNGRAACPSGWPVGSCKWRQSA